MWYWVNSDWVLFLGVGFCVVFVVGSRSLFLTVVYRVVWLYFVGDFVIWCVWVWWIVGLRLFWFCLCGSFECRVIVCVGWVGL